MTSPQLDWRTSGPSNSAALFDNQWLSWTRQKSETHNTKLRNGWLKHGTPMRHSSATFPTPGTSTPLIGRGISRLLTEPYLPHSSRTSSKMSENKIKIIKANWTATLCLFDRSIGVKLTFVLLFVLQLVARHHVEETQHVCRHFRAGLHHGWVETRYLQLNWDLTLEMNKNTINQWFIFRDEQILSLVM